ncbi:MAG: RNA polymerase sigma factor [Clostridia bacterium]|nr:RNA polymerase sigma factor [Clostridia bacterium]
MINNNNFELYAKKYMDMIFKLAFAYLKSEADANDVVQNVLLALYKTNKKFETEEHMKNWIVRCTINECKKIWRMPWCKKVELENEKVNGDVTSKTQNEINSEIDLLNAIMSLDKTQRVIVVLFYIEGYKVKEIAKILRIPEGTVGSRISKIKENLKRYLEGENIYER